MSVGDAYEPAVLDAILGSGHTSRFPATVYLAFFRDDAPPSDAGGGTELSVPRLAIANNSTNWPDAIGDQKSNGTTLTTAPAGTDQPQAGWYALMSASSGGNLVIDGQLLERIQPNAGESIEIPPGGLIVVAD